LAAVIQDIKAKMKEFGLTVAHLGGSASGTKKTAKSKSDAPAKYRGPNGELWAGGLGRKPQWVAAILAEGKSLDDFLI
jgi:DNA-binding protein H-NS